MNNSSRHIIFIGGSIAIISMLYFLSLVIHLPLWAIIPILLATLWLPYAQLYKKNDPGTAERPSLLMLFILTVGIFLITNRSYYMATKYGEWDAWALWNMHAAYLTDPANWKNLFLNTQFAHPDYPLMLPGIVAFFNRIFHSSLMVPFAIHYLIMLLIPVWIYIETYARSTLVAAIILLLFATNDHYIMLGTWQLADTMLGFFFLAAIICIDHGQEDKRMLGFSAFFLGCCMWTKNEGIVLAGIFILFHLREFFSRHTIRYFIIGIAFPSLVLLLFKLGFAPKNDIISAQGNDTLQLIGQQSRYQLIYDFFRKNLNDHFRTVKRGVIIYVIIAAISRRVDKHFLMILCCLAAYMFIYVITPNDLEWHLFTSLYRLMHQLMPAMMYVIAIRFAGNKKEGKRSGFTFQGEFFSARQRLQ